MINEITARHIAVKFFVLSGLSELAGKPKEDDMFCCEDVLKFAVPAVGKARTRELYLFLPKKLKIYFLVLLEYPRAEERLCDRVYAIQHSFNFPADSSRPERLKCFPSYIEKMDNALQDYFRR